MRIRFRVKVRIKEGWGLGLVHLLELLLELRLWRVGRGRRDGRLRGEFTLVLAPLDAASLAAQRAETSEAKMASAVAAVAERLEGGEAISKASKAVAAEFGVAKAKVYAEALRLQQEKKERRRERRSHEGGTE